MKSYIIVLSIFIGMLSSANSREGSESSNFAQDEKLKFASIQVFLDRINFSPGEIDGSWGRNAARAIAAFQYANNLPVTGEPDDETIAALQKATNAEPFVQYALTAADVAGPFVEKIPERMEDQAALPSLTYANLFEYLGEKFHMDPEFLKELNSGNKFTAGEYITVANVMTAPRPVTEKPRVRQEHENQQLDQWSTKTPDLNADVSTSARQHDLTVVVSKTTSTLQVFDGHQLVFHAPVTSGSDHDPLPIGEWKVNGSEKMPGFNYNPELFWDAQQLGDKKLKLSPGPNGPVGVVWIDISKDHYGLHGTPEPGKIGYTESHGCVRLTNWDALKLAGIVKPGTKVIFTE